MDLSGKTLFVTGASRGIGRAIALRYAEEGAELFLTATNRALLDETRALAEAQGAKVTLHVADVIRAGADATGTTSGVVKAENPARQLEEMIKALKNAWQETHP